MYYNLASLDKRRYNVKKVSDIPVSTTGVLPNSLWAVAFLHTKAEKYKTAAGFLDTET